MDGFQKVFELSKTVNELQIIPENLCGGLFFFFFLREEGKHRLFEGGEKKTRDLCGQEDIFHSPYNFLRSDEKSPPRKRPLCSVTWAGGRS